MVHAVLGYCHCSSGLNVCDILCAVGLIEGKVRRFFELIVRRTCPRVRNLGVSLGCARTSCQ